MASTGPRAAAASELLLAIDASTTACKALVFDLSGQVQAEGRAELDLANPSRDAYEQDAEQWWTATILAVKQAIAKLGPDHARRIRALSLTHQRETFVVTDSECRPLHPALVWMDARCRTQVERASAELGRSHLHRVSGKPPCTTASFYKLSFLFERQPALLGRGTRVLDVCAFLGWRMTGRCATSLASADPLGLIDMQRQSWSPELLAFLGLELCNVPELVAPGEPLGMLEPELARQLGLEAPVPLIATAGDGQAAGLGAGITEPGRAYLNLGTAIVSGVLSNSYRTDSAFRTLYAATPANFLLETDLKGGTFTLNWLVEKWLTPAARRGRSVAQMLGELELDAQRLPAGSDGLLLVPYWNGVMNPYWDDHATGIVIGWQGAHGPAHLYRAILEGIAFEQRLHSRAVELATEPITEFVVMGGGSESALWCQILADVLERSIVRASTHEASALGAAILASVATGLHSNLHTAVASMTRNGQTFTSGSASAVYSRLYEEAYAGIYPNLQQQLRALARIRDELG
jgi:sugar (pentulose or hexulose) kinase